MLRLSSRVLRPAANQTGKGMWQDPVFGYFETHGKMEFLPKEDYNLTQEEKQAVLDRHRMKEVLKKEFLRMEYDPINYKYRTGVTMDPAVFRWYAAELTQHEQFRWTPKTVFMYTGIAIVVFALICKIVMLPIEENQHACSTGEIVWWDRQTRRMATIGGVAGGIDDGQR